MTPGADPRASSSVDEGLDPPRSALTRVATYADLPIAEVDRAYLVGQGIPAFIEDANLAGMDSLLMTAIGYVKLTVRAEDGALARSLLATVRREGSAVDDPDAPRCPHCGSGAIASFRPFAFCAIIPIFLPLLLIRRMHCTACRKRWKPG